MPSLLWYFNECFFDFSLAFSWASVRLNDYYICQMFGAGVTCKHRTVQLATSQKTRQTEITNLMKAKIILSDVRVCKHACVSVRLRSAATWRSTAVCYVTNRMLILARSSRGTAEKGKQSTTTTTLQRAAVRLHFTSKSSDVIARFDVLSHRDEAEKVGGRFLDFSIIFCLIGACWRC